MENTRDIEMKNKPILKIEKTKSSDKYILEGVFTEFCPIHCHCYMRLGYGVECGHQKEWREGREREKLIEKRKRIIDSILNKKRID